MKFSWVTILQGVELSIYLLIFEWALQQCSTTAMPAIYHFFSVTYFPKTFKGAGASAREMR